MSGHRAQHDCTIANRSCEGPGLIQGTGEGDDTPSAAPAISRFQAHSTGQGRRLADGSTRICTNAGQGGACGNNRRRPAGRPAGHQGLVRIGLILPGIAHRPIVTGRVGRPHGEFVQVGFAQQHGTRRPQLAADRRFIGRFEPVQNVRGRRRQHPFGAVQILNAQGNAFQWARCTCGQSFITFHSHSAGLVWRFSDIGIQRPGLIHGGQIGLRQFDSGECFLAQAVSGICQA